MLDSGRIRVAEKIDGEWLVNEDDAKSFGTEKDVASALTELTKKFADLIKNAPEGKLDLNEGAPLDFPKQAPGLDLYPTHVYFAFSSVAPPSAPPFGFRFILHPLPSLTYPPSLSWDFASGANARRPKEADL